MKNEELNQWVFNYNSYTGDWRACKREDYLELFTDIDSKKLLKSKDIKTLIEYIIKNQ